MQALKVYNLNSIDKTLFRNAVVSVGIFDGMHKGHAQIIQAMKNKARQIKGETVVVTLWPHPRTVLQPNNEVKLLNTLEEKQGLIEQAGIDHFIVITFDSNFSKLSANDFIKNILIDKIGMHCLVVGFDNHFGHNKEGNYDVIKEIALKFEFEIIHLPAYFEGPERVSSTSVRLLLELGEVDKAANLLGYYYELSGKVVKGNMIGRTIGFPTANIEPDALKMVPRVGVYAVLVDVKGINYKGMLNVGFRPTIEKYPLHKTIEVYIIGFNGDLYEKEISVTFVKRLRDEVKFAGIDKLKAQLEIDKLNTIDVLKNFRQ